MGSFSVSVEHLHYVVDQDKFDHGLTRSDLDGRDKMNFPSVVRMTEDRALQVLRRQSDATATEMFLRITRDILDAFLAEDLSAFDRIFLSWRALFFLRIWREWCLEEGLVLADSFVTSTCFLCFELNGHAMIKIIRRLRDEGLPELFIPELFSSQACEKFFRAARSLCATFATVVNFDLLEFLRRLRRIELQGQIVTQLSGDFVFPR